MTKAEVISQITKKIEKSEEIDKWLSREQVSAAIETFFVVVKDSMADGNNIYMRGFGSFVNKKRARKIARNISKNTAMVVEEHFIPSFKPAKVFLNKIKNSAKVK